MSQITPVTNSVPLTISSDITGKYLAYSTQGTNIAVDNSSNWYYGKTYFSTDYGETFEPTVTPIFPIAATVPISAGSMSILDHYILQTFTWQQKNSSGVTLSYSIPYLFNMLSPDTWLPLPTSYNGTKDACGNYITTSTTTSTYISSIVNNGFSMNGQSTTEFGQLFLFLVTIGNNNGSVSGLVSQQLYQYNPYTLLVGPAFTTTAQPLIIGTGLNGALNTTAINYYGFFGNYYQSSTNGLMATYWQISQPNTTFNTTDWILFGNNKYATNTIGTVESYNVIFGTKNTYFPSSIAVTNTYGSTDTLYVINNVFCPLTSTGAQYATTATALYFQVNNNSASNYNLYYISKLSFKSSSDGSPNALVYTNTQNQVFFPVSNLNTSEPSTGLYFASSGNYNGSSAPSFSEYHIDNNFNYWLNLCTSSDPSFNLFNNLFLVSSTSTSASVGAVYKTSLRLPLLTQDLSGGVFVPNTTNKFETYGYLATQPLPSYYKYLNFLMAGAGGHGSFSYSYVPGSAQYPGAGGSGAGALVISIPVSTTINKVTYTVTSVNLIPGHCSEKISEPNGNTVVDIIYNSDPSNNIVIVCPSALNNATANTTTAAGTGGSGGSLPTILYGANFNKSVWTSSTTNSALVAGKTGSSTNPAQKSSNAVTINGTTTAVYAYSGCAGLKYGNTVDGSNNIYNLSYNRSTNFATFGGTIYAATTASYANKNLKYYGDELGGYGGGGAAMISGRTPDINPNQTRGTNGFVTMFYS